MALKNIQFKDLDVHVLNYRPAPRVLVKWGLVPTAQNIKNLLFFVDRGESPSEMRQLNAIPIMYNDVFEYIDHEGKLKDTEKYYYYQIRAVEYNPAHTTPLQTFSSEVISWEGTLDTVANYVIEEHLFAYRYVFGTPIIIFKKKREGTHCPVCFDVVLKRVTKSNCTTCLGTGFINGFYKPMEGWADLNPDPKAVSIMEFGERQANQTDMQFTNYPLLNGGDIIIELTQTRFWKISNVRNTEKNRITMLQVARMDEVNRSDIEYNLVIPEDMRTRLLAEMAAREKKNEF